jgi:hypothetical protein
VCVCASVCKCACACVRVCACARQSVIVCSVCVCVIAFFACGVCVRGCVCACECWSRAWPKRSMHWACSTWGKVTWKGSRKTRPKGCTGSVRLPPRITVRHREMPLISLYPLFLSASLYADSENDSSGGTIPAGAVLAQRHWGLKG